MLRIDCSIQGRQLIVEIFLQIIHIVGSFNSMENICLLKIDIVMDIGKKNQ